MALTSTANIFEILKCMFACCQHATINDHQKHNQKEPSNRTHIQLHLSTTSTHTLRTKSSRHSDLIIQLYKSRKRERESARGQRRGSAIVPARRKQNRKAVKQPCASNTCVRVGQQACITEGEVLPIRRCRC